MPESRLCTSASGTGVAELRRRAHRAPTLGTAGRPRRRPRRGRAPRMSARSSSSVSNSLTDVANSSSSSGSTRSLTSLSFTWKLTGLPRQVVGGVVLGHREVDVALVAGLHPGQSPLELLHQPAGAKLDRVVRYRTRRRTACPRCCRRNRSPGSRRPRRRARRRSALRRSAAGARPRPRRPPRAPRPDGRVPSRPLYDLTSGGGLTSTSAVNANGAPSAGSSVQSIVGRSTGSIPAAATAREYQAVRWSRSASSTTVSRPTCRATSGFGALPLRKPGTRILRDRSLRAWSNA